MKTLALFSAAAVVALSSSTVRAETGFRDFITARGNQLMEGGKSFRFISFYIPNLTYTEDDMRFEQLSSFRWPAPYEIDDALAKLAVWRAMLGVAVAAGDLEPFLRQAGR